MISPKQADMIAHTFQTRGRIVLRKLLPQEIIADLLNLIIAQCEKIYPADHKPIHTDNPLASITDPNLFVPIAHALKTSGALDAILGPISFLRLPTSGRAVHPNHAEGLGPTHQDGGRLTDMDEFLTMWVPLVEIDQDCGGLGFYPTIGLPTGAIPETGDGIDMGDLVPEGVHMSPGDVLLFHKFMPHVSMPNTSTRIRYSMDMRFCSALSPRMKKPAIDLQAWKFIPRPN
ncbi:MAG: hypothetical protein JNM81_04005 [Rhodospirillaceae bacterium]|nr:hypothetical protein [Rhodospirillaceae bacterium]